MIPFSVISNAVRNPPPSFRTQWEIHINTYWISSREARILDYVGTSLLSSKWHISPSFRTQWEIHHINVPLFKGDVTKWQRIFLDFFPRSEDPLPLREDSRCTGGLCRDVASLLEMTPSPVISNVVRNPHKHIIDFSSFHSSKWLIAMLFRHYVPRNDETKKISWFLYLISYKIIELPETVGSQF